MNAPRPDATSTAGRRRGDPGWCEGGIEICPYQWVNRSYGTRAQHPLRLGEDIRGGNGDLAKPDLVYAAPELIIDDDDQLVLTENDAVFVAALGWVLLVFGSAWFWCQTMCGWGRVKSCSTSWLRVKAVVDRPDIVCGGATVPAAQRGSEAWGADS